MKLTAGKHGVEQERAEVTFSIPYFIGILLTYTPEEQVGFLDIRLFKWSLTWTFYNRRKNL